MTKRYTVLLQSENIVNEGPIHVTQPGIKVGNKMPTPMCSTSIKGNRHLYIPASTDRGHLRRRACAAVGFEGSLPTFGDVNYNYVGGVKGKETARIDPRSLPAIRARNPVIDLFGAGAPVFIQGLVAIQDLVAVEPQIGPRDIRSGVRRDPIKDGDYPINALSEESLGNYDSGLVLTNKRAPYKKAAAQIKSLSNRLEKKEKEAKKKEIIEALNAVIDTPVENEKDIAARIEALEKEMAAIGFSTTSIQIPLSGYEVIPEGTSLKQKIAIRNATPELVGLMLAAFQCSAVDPYIGGKKAAGAGGPLHRQYRVRVLENGLFTDDAMLTVAPFEEIEIAAAREDCFLLAARKAWADTDISAYDFTMLGKNEFIDDGADEERAEAA